MGTTVQRTLSGQSGARREACHRAGRGPMRSPPRTRGNRKAGASLVTGRRLDAVRDDATTHGECLARIGSGGHLTLSGGDVLARQATPSTEGFS